VFRLGAASYAARHFRFEISAISFSVRSGDAPE
jgi:hypothetical protein